MRLFPKRTHYIQDNNAGSIEICFCLDASLRKQVPLPSAGSASMPNPSRSSRLSCKKTTWLLKRYALVKLKIINSYHEQNLELPEVRQKSPKRSTFSPKEVVLNAQRVLRLVAHSHYLLSWYKEFVSVLLWTGKQINSIITWQLEGIY